MGWIHDVKQSVRSLARSPGYAGVIVLTLGLGIGANAAIFSVVNGVLVKPLPFDHGPRLVRVQQVAVGAANPTNLSPLELIDVRERTNALDDVVEYHTMFFNLLENGVEPERVQVGVVSWNFFDLIGVSPLHGRSFLPEEDHIGDEPVLLLGFDYWIRRFGGDPSVVGRSVEMNNRQHLIVGVLPQVPTYPNLNDVWMPWYACPFRVRDGWNLNRQARNLLTIGRMRDGMGLPRASSDTDRVASELYSEYAADYPNIEGISATLTPLKEELSAGARPTFVVLLAMSGFVLLIACANVANLTLVRLNRKSHETAIRKALGAGRGDILRRSVTENVLLALVGGVFGLALAYGSVGMLAEFASNLTPRFAEVRVDGWVMVFGLAAAVLTGVGLGLLGSSSAESVGTTLREGGGKTSAGRSRQRFRSSLVIAQVGLAMTLSVGAGLMIRSFAELMEVDPGYEAEGVLTVTIDLDWATYTTAEQSREFFAALLDEVRGRPQVVAAAVASDFPMSGANFQSQRGLTIEDRPLPAGEQPPRVNARFVSEDYFETLGIPLVQGRVLERADRQDGEDVAVLSRAAARRFFPDRDPLGRRVSGDGGQTWATVVGVVGDIRQAGFESDVNEEVYFPYFRTGFARRLLVKTAGPSTSLARPLTEDVYAVDPRQPVSFIQPLVEAEADRVASPKTTTMLLTLFAGIALLTAGAGILGVVAYTVGLRTREIGIRVALGAERGTVLTMIMREALTLVVAGLVLGAGLAWVLGDGLESLLFSVNASDAASFAAAAGVMLAVGALAAYLPAKRVLRLDPTTAFRQE